MAATFNGSSQYFEVNNVVDISNDYTLCCRFLSTSIGNNQVFFGNFSSADNWGWYFQLQGSETLHLTAAPNWANYFTKVAGALSSNTWYSLVVARTGLTTNWYRDGALQTTTYTANTAANVTASSTLCRIGTTVKAPTQDLVGSVDDLRVYPDKLFTASEAKIYHESNGCDNIISPQMVRFMFVGTDGATGTARTDLGTNGYVATPGSSPTFSNSTMRVIK